MNLEFVKVLSGPFPGSHSPLLGWGGGEFIINHNYPHPPTARRRYGPQDRRVILI